MWGMVSLHSGRCVKYTGDYLGTWRATSQTTVMQNIKYLCYASKHRIRFKYYNNILISESTMFCSLQSILEGSLANANMSRRGLYLSGWARRGLVKYWGWTYVLCENHLALSLLYTAKHIAWSTSTSLRKCLFDYLNY